MNRRGFLAAAGAVIALPVEAWATGPIEVTCGTLRQKITARITIAAPAEKVWALVGNFQDMSWHPAIIAAKGEGGVEPKHAERDLTLAGGHLVVESLEKYDAGKMAYFYRIANPVVDFFPVNNFSAWIKVKPVDGGTEVEWKAAFNRGDMRISPPPELNDEAAIAAVSAYLQSGLQGLKTRIETGS